MTGPEVTGGHHLPMTNYLGEVIGTYTHAGFLDHGVFLINNIS